MGKLDSNPRVDVLQVRCCLSDPGCSGCLPLQWAAFHDAGKVADPGSQWVDWEAEILLISQPPPIFSMPTKTFWSSDKISDVSLWKTTIIFRKTSIACERFLSVVAFTMTPSARLGAFAPVAGSGGGPVALFFPSASLVKIVHLSWGSREQTAATIPSGT